MAHYRDEVATPTRRNRSAQRNPEKRTQSVSEVRRSPRSSARLDGLTARKASQERACYNVFLRTLLETKGTYMDTSDLDITDESKNMCKTLLKEEQCIPDSSLFQDDIFERARKKLLGKNEARVVQDIARLIVPSVENLATFGAKQLEILVESVNEGWKNSIPLTGTCPQPDYFVAFGRGAFSKGQHDKLAPFIGDFTSGDQSFFMATYYMYFPFLTCEVKCGAAAIDIAGRQNAHSMTLAVRAIVELFRLVQREEINREILAFSISHDHRSVRIYGHYAVIQGPSTTFYQHPIRAFDFTELQGKEKWTAYKFTKSIYNLWMPIHFKRLCSAIDAIPSGINFDVLPLPPDSGLSQELRSQHLMGSFAGSTGTEDEDGRPGIGAGTPDASSTRQKRRKGEASK